MKKRRYYALCRDSVSGMEFDFDLEAKRRQIGTCYQWPRSHHSAKPEAFQDIFKHNQLTSMNLEETFYDMHDENAEAAKLQESCSNAGHRRESLYWQMDVLRKEYGRKLRKLVQQRASRIVRNNSHAWCVDVDVSPLHNHITHETLPLITIRWADKGTDLKLTCVPSVPCMLEQFLDRFEHVVKATQLHRRDREEALSRAVSDSLAGRAAGAGVGLKTSATEAKDNAADQQQAGGQAS